MSAHLPLPTSSLLDCNTWVSHFCQLCPSTSLSGVRPHCLRARPKIAADTGLKLFSILRFNGKATSHCVPLGKGPRRDQAHRLCKVRDLLR